MNKIGNPSRYNTSTSADVVGYDNFMRSYRYGFNGKELDNEIKGEGNSYDFGARMQDPRVGRWFAVDPLAKKYPDLSPYNFTANNPIIFVDSDGEKILIAYDVKNEDGTIEQKKVQYKEGKLYDDKNNEVIIENDFVNQTRLALQKIDGSKSVKEEFDKLVNDTEKEIKITYKKNESYSDVTVSPSIVDGKTSHNASIYQKISYDPYIGLKEVNGNGFIPGYIVLGHELGHIYDALFETEDYVARREKYAIDSPDYKYTNPEEKHDISEDQGFESKLVKENPEVYKRSSHKTSAGEVEQVRTNGPLEMKEKIEK